MTNKQTISDFNIVPLFDLLNSDDFQDKLDQSLTSETGELLDGQKFPDYVKSKVFDLYKSEKEEIQQMYFELFWNPERSILNFFEKGRKVDSSSEVLLQKYGKSILRTTTKDVNVMTLAQRVLANFYRIGGTCFYDLVYIELLEYLYGVLERKDYKEFDFIELGADYDTIKKTLQKLKLI